jgi:hypothetical protein
MSFETILQKNLEQFIDQFVKSRFLQVVSYIQNFFKENFVEKLSSIILRELSGNETGFISLPLF